MDGNAQGMLQQQQTKTAEMQAMHVIHCLQCVRNLDELTPRQATSFLKKSYLVNINANENHKLEFGYRGPISIMPSNKQNLIYLSIYILYVK